MDYSQIADLYDSYVRTSLDVPFFLQEARTVRGETLELMCGTGRLSLPLLEAGMRLTCVDYSPEMLHILQRKLESRGLTAPVYAQDVRELSLPQRFDLILIPFNAFAELTSTADQEKTLQRVREHLGEEGTFICTLHNPQVRLKLVDGQLRLRASPPLLDRPGRLLLWSMESYHLDRSLVEGFQFYEEYDERGLLQAKRMIELHFAVITQDAFAAMADRAGFEVTALLGDYAYSPFEPETSPFMIWKLKKK